ncbi:carboxypeptidase regulatory-like domain-containing protein [Candidatus Margulisiibacteriota bacterium]
MYKYIGKAIILLIAISIISGCTQIEDVIKKEIISSSDIITKENIQSKENTINLADGVIRGILHNSADEPVTNAYIYLYKTTQIATAGNLKFRTAANNLVTYTTADSDGSFAFENLVSGNYYLVAINSAGLMAQSQNLELTVNADLNVGTLILKTTGSIEGNITFQDKLQHNGIEVYLPGTSYVAMTDASGNYQISEVPEGSYLVYFTYIGYIEQITSTVNVIAEEALELADRILVNDPDYALGLKGETGDQGEQGEQGVTGNQGDQGDSGEQGEEGGEGPIAYYVPTVSIEITASDNEESTIQISADNQDRIYSFILRWYENEDDEIDSHVSSNETILSSGSLSISSFSSMTNRYLRIAARDTNNNIGDFSNALNIPSANNRGTPYYLSQWGESGSGDGEFNSPHDVTIGPDNKVYIADTENDRVQVFSLDGTFDENWGTNGSGGDWAEGSREFDALKGIDLDENGNICIADSDNERIQVFYTDETLVKIGDGVTGTGDMAFDNPQGVVMDANGDIYVADDGNHRIQVIYAEGGVLKIGANNGNGTSGTGDGEFSLVKDVALDPEGNIYVTDEGNNRVQKFDSEGSFIRKWGSQGTGDGEFSSPYSIAIDNENNVYVTDADNNRVQKFTADGEFIWAYGKQDIYGDFQSGSGNGEFDYPVGLAFDNDNNFYVVEKNNNRIQKFSINRRTINLSLGQ